MPYLGNQSTQLISFLWIMLPPSPNTETGNYRNSVECQNNQGAQLNTRWNAFILHGCNVIWNAFIFGILDPNLSPVFERGISSLIFYNNPLNSLRILYTSMIFHKVGCSIIYNDFQHTVTKHLNDQCYLVHSTMYMHKIAETSASHFNLLID